MVAVAASPTPGSAAIAPFAAKSNEHPPYRDMIVSAIVALKDKKGSSRIAISKYIDDNYSGLPSSHAALLNQHLRRLQSKGVIRMLKHSFKLADKPSSGYLNSDVGSKKRGRPLKDAHPAPRLLYNAPKRRGRPTKLVADPPPSKKRKSVRLPNMKSLLAVDPSSVYVLPQAEQLKSGFLQSLPGAVAIIIPHGLLSKKTARSPVLILPNGVQSLIDASAGRKKLGRPRKNLIQENQDQQRKEFGKRQPIPRRRKAVQPKQVLLHSGDNNGDHVDVARKPGRPRKVSKLVVPKNSQVKMVNGDKLSINEAQPRIFENAEKPTMPEVVQGKQNAPGLEWKKRPVGRPRKHAIVDGPNSAGSNAKAS